MIALLKEKKFIENNLENSEHFLTYLKHLLQHPIQLILQLKQAENRMERISNKYESQSIQILLAYYQRDYSEGKYNLIELLKIHHSRLLYYPWYLSSIKFYQKYDDLSYYHQLLKKLNQTLENTLLFTNIDRTNLFINFTNIQCILNMSLNSRSS